MSTWKFLFETVIIASILLLFFSQHPKAQEPKTYINYAQEFRGPLAYRDVKSEIIVYVESDGRHVTAISKEGKILWLKNPFQDAGLKPYRVDYPQIIYIGPPQKWMLQSLEDEDRENAKYIFIGIDFNSSQFGVINLSNGQFTFMGQD